jgi:hypothetical protein
MDSNIKTGVDVTVLTEGSAKNRAERNVMFPVELEFTMRESPQGVATRVRSQARLLEQAFLEISASRVYVAP